MLSVPKIGAEFIQTPIADPMLSYDPNYLKKEAEAML